MYGSMLKELAERFPVIEDVTPRDAQGWLVYLASEKELANSTIALRLGAYRKYWGWLMEYQYIDIVGSPWRDAKPVGETTKKRNMKREAYQDQDIQRLLAVAKNRGDEQLYCLIRLGMFTGARIEELCNMQIKNVHADYFHIVSSKTDAGIRKVPIHSEIQQMVQMLIDESEDGYLISGLSENKYGDRSNAVGKRFGHLKTALGFGTEHNFHSFRRTVLNKMSEALVPLAFRKEIVGHEVDDDITTGTYGVETRMELLSEMIEKVKYTLV